MGGTPVLAADETVTAYNPGGIAKAMRDAGYKADLDVDGYGDPMIKTAFGQFDGFIYFYGCDETNHDRCESLQFRAGFDREKPMPLSLLNEIVTKYRYTAMWLDKDGDPWVNFDLVTGAGIPRQVFIRSLEAYSDNLTDVSDMIFAEERGN
ncbi:hypothetical protein GRI40_01600 [Altererythrobacter aerius]|uniref:YbjN domain-containing protein n=1 Tax=Tsuneonella aeria TaxID=1837929 RepID=A0A6I4TBZ2_9SPHN|nr:YbjN domain-containing protein [Tsuneonella aeria]MXO73918.1 hypothetical protein [Tsuneonella aeria]